MRTHTSNFKNALKETKEQEYKVIYGTTTIYGNDLKNFNPVVNSDLIKTVMKEFYFETPKKIEIGTIINAQQGILVEENYEYINYGDYIIKDSEYNPNSKTYSYKCYDYMLKTMIDYKELNVTYPITIKDYIKAICNYCGLEFASYNDDFVNSTKTINEDYFNNGDYTFRDILDYISQLVGGWICIDKDNKVEVRYTNETNETFDDDYIRNINVDFNKKYGPVNSIVFSRGAGSDNIYRKDDTSIKNNGLCEIKIADNPFLESDNREDFIDGIFNKLKGLEFYILDVDTVGILFLEVGDLYNFEFGNPIKTSNLKSGLVKSGLMKSQSAEDKIQYSYKCLLLNSEIKTIDGLTETQYVEEPQTSVTDYKTSAPTDNSIKNAIIQTNKNSAEILLKVNSDKVISAINLSPEQITIDTSKLDINGIATFTNSKLAEAGSTVINGDNITTGTINASLIKSGTLSADRISGGTISASTISLKNVSLTPTSSKIAGWNIDSNRLYTGNNGIYANGEIYMYPTAGGILALNDGFRLKAPSGIAIYNSYTSYGGGTSVDAGINIMADAGNLNLMSYSSTKSVNIRSYCSPSTVTNAGAGGIMLAAANNISLHSVAGNCYAKGNNISNALIKTDQGSASSRSVKENIVEFDKTEYTQALDLLENIKIYNYDYKYKLYNDKHQYGFIIDEIEKFDNKFFKINKDNAIVNGEELDFNLDNKKEDSEIIEVKKYDSDVLDKYLLTCIKALQNKIKELEAKI